MFEKLGRNAQQLASQLPRRAFFGKVAQAALPVAAAIGALMAPWKDAAAIGRGGNPNCCLDPDTFETVCKKKSSERCPDGTVAGQCGHSPGTAGKQPPPCYPQQRLPAAR